MRDDDLLRHYLLGELSDEDTELLEARLIQDEDLFERAEAMEADLLEEHVHGGLSAAQRARIRRHLASSDASRSQMAMVRGIGDIGKAVREERPWWRVLIGPWGPADLSSIRVQALAAAMLAVVVGAAWLDYRTSHLQTEIEHIAQQVLPMPDLRPVPPRFPPGPPTEQDKIADVEPTPELVPTATPAPAPFEFILALTALRGPEDGAKELRIPAGTKRVEIHLPLSSEDEASPSFQVVLRAPDGTELIRRTDLLPVKTGERSDLVLPVEAKLLSPGRYSVEVYGESDDNPLGFPEFEVPEP
jgi:hypothetical protein